MSGEMSGNPFGDVDNGPTADDIAEIGRDVCDVCGGYGQVPAWCGSLFYGTLEMTAQDCPECGGSGTKKEKDRE